MDKLKVINRAKIYLRGQALSDVDFLQLYTDLTEWEQFGYAAEALYKNMAEKEHDGKPVTIKNYQDLAKNIYKDDSLSSYFKFDTALNILSTNCKLEETANYETLGLAGAIYKYRWKFDHQATNLLKSEAYYKRGYKIWKGKVKPQSHKTDNGYTAINYAYISELIAAVGLEKLSEVTGITDDTIDKFVRAQEARMKIIETYISNPKDRHPEIIHGIRPNYWLYATLAEAFFGLRKYKQAAYLIKKYMKMKALSWEIKTFMRQMYHLAYMQEVEKKYAAGSKVFRTKDIDIDMMQKCLLEFNPDKGEQCKVTISAQKKTGLCLSGGGFRAALFHIGVLAGLAEKGRLKDIEVISCVSGGSIIGAYYYLELKKLLESTEDGKITRQHYINIVKSIEDTFLEGVQKNIRVRLFRNFYKNLKMLFLPGYSRSHVLGELYEAHFYNKIFSNDGKRIYMEDLVVKIEKDKEFNINENWKRENKVPQLILNATTVNTGHNWQFTARWMGEPPGCISSEFDVKPRLRRMYYKNAPPAYRNFPLGSAVAASSCVPVLFEPLVLRELYEGIDLELVDGGVHDNQGIASVLEQECDDVIISDGSAQMGADLKNTANEFSLFYRVDSIAQERVRELQLLDMKEREYTSALLNLEIIHLKSELNQPPVSWINCTDSPRVISYDKEEKKGIDVLTYGILKKVQQGLSEIRTDLDSHNDMESYALMYSGYRQVMKEQYQGDTNDNYWNFFKAAPSCITPAKSERLLDILKISKSVFFKAAKILSHTLLGIFFIILLGLLLLSIITWLFLDNLLNDADLLTRSNIAIDGVILLITYMLALLGIARWISNPRTWVRNKLIMTAIVFFGWIASNLYLIFFNPVYNWFGRIKNKE